MTRIAAIALLSVCLISPDLFADDGFTFSINPVIGRIFGHTSYVMDAQTYDSVIGTYRMKSKLEFPLDISMAGATVGFTQYRAERKYLSVELGFAMNVNDPGGAMKDHDWIGPTDRSLIKWSYTESEDDLKALILTAEVAGRLYSRRNSEAFIFAGFKYQKLKQDVFGYEGWQLYSGEGGEIDTLFIADDTVKAMYYEVTYKTPLIGLKYCQGITSPFSANLTAAYVMVLASDVDDHFLRYKISTADGIGYGFYSDLYIRYIMSPKSNGIKPFITVGGEFLTMKVATDQTQKWYGDDPISEEDDTGQVTSNIPHEISSTQFMLGLKLGIEF